MGQVAPPIRKIQGNELRQLVEERTGEAASVIIQLELSPRAVESSGAERGGAGLRRALVVAPETSEERREVRRRASQTKRFLTKVLGDEPLWLQSARAFVAKASGEQLREIAESPLVKAIHPNRRLG